MIKTGILTMIARTDGCWTWLGAKNNLGYGQVQYQGRRWYVHRLMCIWNDKNVVGLDVDHLCRNPSCVNPDHLEPVTHRENIIRGFKAKRPTCSQGHLREGANVRRNSRGHLYCLPCRLAKGAENRKADGYKERAREYMKEYNKTYTKLPGYKERHRILQREYVMRQKEAHLAKKL